ncbi:hypothetical protein ALNOE001_03260 [Candidatus Methanobinarius endosymbioticus]|uniref:Uncharacterized protein n=1 Tax=Candidatus Methanobinarius endosymbioticus TaxID=2006182 RepID=A0A366MEI1_9EURY|nr:hypothetical protein ALNOE001_03260 [Candidatus Methanobinarius endosymbioticus]
MWDLVYVLSYILIIAFHHYLSFLYIIIGMAVYILTELSLGWIPISYGIGVIIIGILIALAIAISIWAGFIYTIEKKFQL